MQKKNIRKTKIFLKTSSKTITINYQEPINLKNYLKTTQKYQNISLQKN